MVTGTENLIVTVSGTAAVIADYRGSIGSHSTPTSDESWDGPANVARLRNDESATYYRKMFAWVDPDGEADAKSSYKFPHHLVSSDGEIGAAVLRACSAGIAVLNGGRGGADIPSSDRQGVWSHLAAHMRSGDAEPPELNSFLLGYERRSYPAEELRIIKSDDAQTKLRWYPAVFNTLSEDLMGFRERIAHGAFRKTIAENDIRALFNHDPNFVLGRNTNKTLMLEEDRKGLLAEVTLPNTSYARDLLEVVERGDISGGSFGFIPIREKWLNSEDGSLVRELREVKLYDVSPVTFPAYPATEGVSVRSLLRGTGFEIEEVIRPFLLLRAGSPPAADERRKIQGLIEKFQTLLVSAPPEKDWHPQPLSLWKRKLEFLALQ